MQGKRILFFNNSEDLARDGVLQSQVLGQARYLQSLGAECLVLGFADDAAAAVNFVEAVQRGYGVACRMFAAPPGRGVPLLSKYLFARRLLAAFRADLERFRPTHVYTRALQAFGPGRRLARRFGAVHVHGVRGAVAAECLMHPPGDRRRRYYPVFLRLEKSCIRRAERLSVVSQTMRQWLRDEFGRDDAVVVPCCIDRVPDAPEPAMRAAVRAELGFAPEQRVLCYCGGTAVWQKLDEIVRLTAALAPLLPQWRYLFICRDRPVIDRLAREAGLPPELYRVAGGDQAAAARWLTAAEAGVILRERDLVNAVSCPVKVGEYLASGLPLVMSPGIGDLSALVAGRQLGVTAVSAADAPAVAAFLGSVWNEGLREQARRFARDYFEWSNYRQAMEELFE